MREIEFRGKSKYNNEFVYGNLIKIHTKNGSGYGIKKNPYHINDNCVNPIPDEIISETVGQYTGLKDKNGVKIFEGDIVKYKVENNSELDVITYDSIAFNLLVAYAGNDQKKLKSFDFKDLSKELEVVGNIFDTPELLK